MLLEFFQLPLQFVYSHVFHKQVGVIKLFQQKLFVLTFLFVQTQNVFLTGDVTAGQKSGLATFCLKFDLELETHQASRTPCRALTMQLYSELIAMTYFASTVPSQLKRLDLQSS